MFPARAFSQVEAQSSEAATATDPSTVIVILQKQRNPADLRAAGDRVAEQLAAKIDRKVVVQIPSDYSASIQALVSKRADIAYLDSLSFLLAKRDGGASILLGEQRLSAAGVLGTSYDSVLVVRKDSPLMTLSDLVKNRAELRVALTSRTSTSGYLFPYMQFVKSGILAPKQPIEQGFKSVTFAGGYDLALKQLLLNRADVAAVSFYAVEGASATKYLTPEELAQLRILARIPGVPTHVIAVRDGLTEAEKLKFSKALLELSSEKPELFKDVYGAAALVAVDPSKHVLATEQAVEVLGIFPG